MVQKQREKSVVTRWWFIRHAPVVAAQAAYLYGCMDVAADVSGDVEPYRDLARRLPEDPVCLVSNLSRTLTTMRAVNEHRDAVGRKPFPDPIVDGELREQNFGAWQGMERQAAYAMIARELPGSRGVALRPADYAPPQGESFAELCRRVDQALSLHNREHSGRDVICFSHGGVIRAALRLALGLAADTALQFIVDNLALTRLDLVDGEWRVAWVNQLITAR